MILLQLIFVIDILLNIYIFIFNDEGTYAWLYFPQFFLACEISKNWFTTVIVIDGTSFGYNTTTLNAPTVYFKLLYLSILFLYKIYVNNFTILTSCAPKDYWSVNSFLTICPSWNYFTTSVFIYCEIFIAVTGLAWFFKKKKLHLLLF